jgi:p-aminobenzoyl-glutamate transporter AbgT
MLVDILTTIVQQVNITGLNSTAAIELPVITLQNAFGNLTAALITITLMLAIAVRTGSEALAKWINGEIESFKPKYLVTAFIAFIGALPLAMYLFPGAADIFLANFGVGGLVGALIMVGFYGYAANHGVNKLASLLGHFFTPAKAPEPPTQPATTTTETKTS